MTKNELLGSYNILNDQKMSPLALLAHADPREKFIDLVLNGIPPQVDQETATHFHSLQEALRNERVEDAKVVVFGGGTGLSNIIGGDSRRGNWTRSPFTGLKEVFPKTRSIVCVTDDGGSTGELIKDVPLIALGDLRHVLLSSIQLGKLQKLYNVSIDEAREIVEVLTQLFNYRFESFSGTWDEFFIQSGTSPDQLPSGLRKYIENLVKHLLKDTRLQATLLRPQCLGNLILASAIYQEIDGSMDNDFLEENLEIVSEAIYKGLSFLSHILAAEKRAVMPCTSTPARLRMVYTNGVQIAGESKSSYSSRGFPVDSVHVDFCGEIYTYSQVLDDIKNADIIILAPGSLYSSIIPIFQIPGLVEAVRNNENALKILIANIWVQAGETDLSITDPDRKFHVSDMIQAYERNIPGGVTGLFREVLCLSLKDVPGSILQRYGVEGKMPIFLDRSVVCDQGFSPIECEIFSKPEMVEHGVIQHDPHILAQAVKTIFIGERCLGFGRNMQTSYKESQARDGYWKNNKQNVILPSNKYRKLHQKISNLDIREQGVEESGISIEEIRKNIVEIVWKHKDIPLSHLDFIQGVQCIDRSKWSRDQRWDNVFSFFDPARFEIIIRKDQLRNFRNLEVAFLVALGQSLLGNYVARKEIQPIVVDSLTMGKVYHLHVKKESERKGFFNDHQLTTYLSLARMFETNSRHFTRLINGKEGFTPPGLLMGLIYAWYLENRLASHIEYKMSVMRINPSDLIPEQLRMSKRREKMITFFREVVFLDGN